MRKGFTIVELAIVLVVIGIIMAMAIKGKNLVDTARFRMEINKIYKLEAAVHIYLSTHPELITNTNTNPTGYQHPWGDLNMQNLYDAGIVNQKELESMTRGALSDGTVVQGTWTPIHCQYYTPGHGSDPANMGLIDFYRGTNQTIAWRPTNYCARILLSITTDSTSSRMLWLYMPPRIQCGIEVFMDDENTKTGAARQVWSLQFPEFTREEYNDCMMLSMEMDYADMGVVIY